MNNLTPGLHMFESIEATGLDMAQIGFFMAACPFNQPGNRLKLNFNWTTSWQKGLTTSPAKGFGGDFNNSQNWGPIGFYVLNEANVQAKVAEMGGYTLPGQAPYGSVKLGDDLAINGTYVSSTTSSANYVQLVKGVFWGNFEEISMWKPSSGTDYIKVIIGPRK